MRKATMSTLTILIIFIAVFIVLMVGIGPIYKWIASMNKDKACQLSVIQHSLSDKISLVVEQGTDIHCYRKELVFTDTQTVVDGKRISVYANEGDTKKSATYKSLNKYIVNQVLADQMYKCWTIMGSGNVSVFNPDFADPTKITRPCIVCTSVRFDIGRTDQFDGLGKYLRETVNPHTKTIYLDSLNKPTYKYLDLGTVIGVVPYSQHFFDYVESVKVPDTIDPNKQYYVYFVGWRPSQLPEWAGYYKSAYFLNVGPIEELQKCEYLYN
jgi:hypothetical protein